MNKLWVIAFVIILTTCKLGADLDTIEQKLKPGPDGLTTISYSGQLTNDAWLSIFADIASAGKDVALDLSNCTVPGGVFSPPSHDAAGFIVSITLPNNTTTVNPSFSTFNKLQTVNGASVTSISANTFTGCTALTAVHFPLVTSIGNSAFAQTGPNPLTITLGYTPPTAVNGIFGTVTAPKTVTVQIPPGATGYDASWRNNFQGGNQNIMLIVVYIGGGLVETPTVHSVTITTENNITMIAPGTTLQCTAVVNATGGAATTVNWSINPPVNGVSISTNGLLTVNTIVAVETIIIVQATPTQPGFADRAATILIMVTPDQIPQITINIPTIIGVTLPVTGAIPVTSIMETDQYTGTVVWNPAVSGTFAPTTVYTAIITLTAKERFTFNGVAENFFTVAGTIPTMPATNPANSGMVTARFPPTAPEMDVPFDTGVILTVTAMNAGVNYTIIPTTPAASAYYLHYMAGNHSANGLIDYGNDQLVTVLDGTLGSLTNDMEYSFVVIAELAGRLDSVSDVVHATPTFEPAVINVTVTAEDDAATVAPGESLQFFATVDAIGGAATTVTWSIASTGHSAGTRIDPTTGLLTVAQTEAQPAIAVRATSTQPGFESVSGTIAVTVMAIPATATITFNANGADGTAPPPLTVNVGSNIILPNGDGLFRNGYHFGGWNTEADGTGENYAFGSEYTVTGDITLYAKWDESMVWIPDGSYTRGSEDNEDLYASPAHTVTLTQGFYMGKYQVTQEQYMAVMGNNPSRFSSNPAAGEVQGRRPVEQVSWYDAIVFCNRLSILEGLSPAYHIPGYGNSYDPEFWIASNGGTIPGSSNATWNAVQIVPGSTGYRLPTEAQWEYACRAGITTAYNTGDTISDDTGWYNANSDWQTHEVGLKPANAWGLYDMHGNVWEWCWDWYSSYQSDAWSDPTGPPSGFDRVIRGGSWNYDEQNLRSAFRSNYIPYLRYFDLGFRLLRP
ncbi:MAG: SUMF1/EgtB/PvdO family nonheme iron enzyme [Treponema sp.]|nr:SUMF1/EgtB/PvdO family nonheme iron enzyme [Treponema sp.]